MKTITLVVICGLIHGLVIMPAVFALSWNCLGYLRKVFGFEHHDMMNRHVHTADVLPPKRGDSLDQRERQSQSFSYSNLLLSAGQTEKQDLLQHKEEEFEDHSRKDSNTSTVVEKEEINEQDD